MQKNNYQHVIEHPNIRIKMTDGCKLSARIWMPTNARTNPVPAILEHLPYRKRDGTAYRDNINHPWFAKHGYACIRTDLRGNGDSEGLMTDEYLQQELDDAVEVIKWIVKQPWCSGKVGMMGISWGGFNSLQVAALAPPELKAIITICSSVDRFADDIHFKGGCLLGANFTWAGQMLSYSSRPPDPLLFGSNWKTEWLKRLKNLPLLADNWLEEQRRSNYWIHGSVCEDYRSIKAPVLAVGGLHDGYRNTVAKLVSNLSSHVEGIIGPWNHRYPHLAEPKPRIDFLREALRWWDRWLKNIEAKDESNEDYKVYVMSSAKPLRRLKQRSGEWKILSKNDLNFPSFKSFELEFDTRRLGHKSIGESVKINNLSKVGSKAGAFFPYNFGPELPADQILDDKLSKCFDSDKITEAIEIIGAPILDIIVSSDKPLAQLAVRLCDLRPDGTSALIAHGFRNLTMSNSFENPKKLRSGRKYQLRVELDQAAYCLPRGHRLRLALSNSYWPFIWPSPELTQITIYKANLLIPIFDRTTQKTIAEPFSSFSKYNQVKVKVKRSPTSTRKEFLNKKNNKNIIEIKHDSGCTIDLEHHLETDSCVLERYLYKEGDPSSAEIDVKWYQLLRRKDWHVYTESNLNVTCDKKYFFLKATVEAWENSKSVFIKNFNKSITRKFV